MASITDFIERRLRLKVNAAKSAGASGNRDVLIRTPRVRDLLSGTRGAGGLIVMTF